MTTIIMVEDVEGITIGYDSQVTMGSSTVSEMPDNKVFLVGDVIFGVCGSAVFINEIKYMDLPKLEGDPQRWIVKEFLPLFRELKKEIDPENETDLNMLMVAGGKVFEVCSEQSVTRKVCGQYSVGSGSSFALGALASDATVDKALEVAAQLDCFTGGTLHVTTPEALKMREAPLEAS